MWYQERSHHKYRGIKGLYALWNEFEIEVLFCNFPSKLSDAFMYFTLHKLRQYTHLYLYELWDQNKISAKFINVGRKKLILTYSVFFLTYEIPQKMCAMK